MRQSPVLTPWSQHNPLRARSRNNEYAPGQMNGREESDGGGIDTLQRRDHDLETPLLRRPPGRKN